MPFACALGAGPTVLSLAIPFAMLEPIRAKLGEPEAGARAHEASLTSAIAAGDDDTALAASVALVYVEGYQLERFDAGERWLRQADAWLRRAGDDGMLMVRRHLYEGLMRREQGRLRVLRPVELLLGALPRQAGDGLADGGIGCGEHGCGDGGGLGERAAHLEVVLRMRLDQELAGRLRRGVVRGPGCPGRHGRLVRRHRGDS